MSPTLPALRKQLDIIADREQATLGRRMADTQMFAQEADRLTAWLAWVGVLIGIGAITLGLIAYQAIMERLVARKDAETEAGRAQPLEQAVEERTREPREANEMMRSE